VTIVECRYFQKRKKLLTCSAFVSLCAILFAFVLLLQQKAKTLNTLLYSALLAL